MPKPILLEVMKARAGIPTNDLFAMLWAQKLRAGSSSVQTLTGIPPLSFKSNGTPLISWSMKGNGSQSSAPTPDNPIQPEFVGMRTGNLYDISAKDTNNGYINKMQLNLDGTTEGWVSSEVTEYIEVAPSTGYTLSDIGGYNSLAYCFYDADRQYISGDNYRGRLIITFTTPSNCKYLRFTHFKTRSNTMLNLGYTALPYEPYGYKIPISCGGQTIPVYLGEVPTVRKIRKLVLDGMESISYNARNDTIGRWVVTIPIANGTTTPENVICTHFVTVNSTTTPLSKGGICMRSTGVDIVVGGLYTDIGITAPSDSATIVNAVEAFLAAKYASGTPVTVWYVLATEQTGIVNEPLCKIGDYADELHSTDAGVTIPTVKGDNVLTVDTPIQPSEMSITYKG